jgi:hypothetical protein
LKTFIDSNLRVKKIPKHLIVCALWFLQYNSFGQSLQQKSYNQNAWFMYFGNHKINNKWGLHLEAQLRRHNWLAQKQQVLFRTGINYYANTNSMATIGYAFVQTAPYGGQPAKAAFPENRLWQQYQIKTALNHTEWVSRFRLEQRFVNIPTLQNLEFKPGKPIFTNRFRLLNRFSKALNTKKIEDKSVYISAFNEIMVNFGNNVAANIFDQSRIYIALGYQLPKWGRVELGFLEQDILKSDGIKIEKNRTLQLGLSSNFSFAKK